MSERRALTLLPGRFAVCRLDPDAPLPAWLFHAGQSLWSLTRTPRELSLVCPQEDLPPSFESHVERDWRALELEGPVPFATTGVLAALTAPLAAARVPVFALSTYDTDLLLVKQADLERTRAALAATHEFREAL